MEKVARSDELIRVVLTGSESTGKTALARQLADHYSAELTPEFVRDFGVRTEINMVVGSRDATVTGPLQTEILSLM